MDNLSKTKSLFQKYQAIQPSLQEKQNFIDGNVFIGSTPSIPSDLRARLSSRSGIASMIIDILASRLVYQGVNYDESDSDVYLDINGILEKNDFDMISQLLIFDALVFGVAFCLVGNTGDDQNDISMTAISPLNVFAEFDPLTKQVSSAILVNGDDFVTLYTQDEVVYYQRDREVFYEIDSYNVSSCPLVAVFNQATSMQFGKSELSCGVRDAISSYMRINLRKEVSEELYSSLDVTILGGAPDLLVDEDGRPTEVFSTTMGKTRQIMQPMVDPKTGTLGEVPQLSWAPRMDPKPFLDSLDGKLAEIAIMTGIPTYMLSQSVIQSADALGILEQRLIRASEQRRNSIQRGFRQIIIKMFELSGMVPDAVRRLTVTFASPSTPTMAAGADAALKLVQAGVLKPDSPVLLAKLGLSSDDISTIESENTLSAGSSMLAAIRNQGVMSDGNTDSGSDSLTE